ncbi:MAG: DoxX family protein [Terriglobales bacterium]
MKAAYLLGRLGFGSYFLYSGIHHFRHTGPLAAYAGGKKVPAPAMAVRLTGAALALGGASIILGLKPHWGAAAVIAFLAGVSPVMHDYWRREEAGERQTEMVNFSKNMALLAAAMMVSGMERARTEEAAQVGSGLGSRAA